MERLETQLEGGRPVGFWSRTWLIPLPSSACRLAGGQNGVVPGLGGARGGDRVDVRGVGDSGTGLGAW